MINHDQRNAHRKFHDHLRKERGSASTYMCVDCDKPAKEWSWDNSSLETYGSKSFGASFDEYSPRCQSCHRKKDGVGFTHSSESREKMRRAKLGTKQTDEHRAAISAGLTGRTRDPFSEEHKKNLSTSAKRGWIKRRGQTND